MKYLHSNQQRFSLVEVLVAITILLLVMASPMRVLTSTNNSTTYTGWGKLRNDSLWLAFHVQEDTSSYDCKYFGQSLR